MKLKLAGAAVCALMLAMAVPAAAEGELNIFNWGDYTNPELVKKFEEKYQVKVTVTDYDSNDTALAKVRAGGHGFDIVVPSASVMPIWISEGLLLESRPDQMENFKNVDAKWVEAPFDPGRHYSVPWQWGTTGVYALKSLYSGDVNTSAIWLDPPPELVGKINVVPEMGDVMSLAIMYMGGEPCSGDKEVLKKVRDKLVEAKPNWISMDYGSVEKIRQGRFCRRRELEWLVIPRTTAERQGGLWLSQGRLSGSHGQCGDAQGRQERGECQTVPEFHHGSRECRDDFGLCALQQRHQGFGRIHA